jgi:hypothetical protein
MLIMKYAIAAALMTIAISPVAYAETAAPAAAKFNVDMPIETLAADPAAKAALEASLPGLTTHAMYEQFKGMSLTQLQPMASDKITDEALTKLKAALAEIK